MVAGIPCFSVRSGRISGPARLPLVIFRVFTSAMSRYCTFAVNVISHTLKVSGVRESIAKLTDRFGVSSHCHVDSSPLAE